jgi:hypothetical protein
VLNYKIDFRNDIQWRREDGDDKNARSEGFIEP